MIIIKCTQKKWLKCLLLLNSSDNKRLQTFDRVTTYPYGTNAVKVCESEMLGKISCNV